MRILMLAVVALIGLSMSVHAAPGGVVSGVGAPGSGQVTGTAEIDTSVSALIDFDANPAPCLFAETVALRRYAGTKFRGVGTLDGGAILDQCSNFGVSGFSPPNFLAFNCQANLGDGGIPRLPEKIIFEREVTGLSLKLGSGRDVGKVVKFIGADALGNKQRRSLTLAPTLQSVSFTQPVKRLTIKSDTVCEFVVDDISFD